VLYSVLRVRLKLNEKKKEVGMNFRDTVLENLGEDFNELLPKTPGYLNCNILVGFGDCEKGITPGRTKKDGIMLLGSSGFEFERVLKLISGFSNSKSRRPLLLCVILAIPSGTTCFYRFYEIEEKGNDILLKNQSRVGI